AWRVESPGMLQRAAAGNTGDGLKLYLAYGRGRGQLDVPLTIDAIDPKNGQVNRVAQWQSPRADFTHLSVTDGELVYAAFESKYSIREWRSGAPGHSERMATSRTFADLDGDGQTDRVIGRIYGDAVRSEGDLRVEFGNGKVAKIPVAGGVRSLAVADTKIDAVPTLYFADGWSASYAKEGRALLKRAEFRDGKFEVTQVVQSHDEYTFNRVVPVGLPGNEDLLLYGSARVSWVFRDEAGAVGLRPMAGKHIKAFGELIRDGDRVWMASAGSPSLIEEAPSLR
ncbi:MAG: hypothetical protein AAFQ82_09255, partial [Myxococcota bacterium]